MREITKFILNNWVMVLPLAVFIFILLFVAARYYPNNPAISTIKKILKVILTNRINLLTIFIAVYVASSISNMLIDKFTLGQALFGAIYLVLGYGIMFWIGFIICISALDVLLFGFVKHPQYTNYKLVIEWLIISAPFIYWLVRYNQWIFLIAVLAFLLGQYLRRPYIFRILAT